MELQSLCVGVNIVSLFKFISSLPEAYVHELVIKGKKEESKVDQTAPGTIRGPSILGAILYPDSF